VEIKQFPISLTEQNIGATVDYQIIIKDYGTPNQSKIYFQVGDIPIPLAIGSVFEISNNADGFNGLYSVINILLEEATGLRILIINLDYTAGGVSSSATGTFDNQLATYDVLEFRVVISDVAAGEYYVRIDATGPTDKYAVSEPINVQTSHRGTLGIIYSNTDNDFGAVFTTGYRGFKRIAADIFKRNPGGERSTTRSSNDSLIKIKARKRRLVDFESDLLPPYEHEKLSIIFDCDFFSVNLEAFQAPDGWEAPQYLEKARLSMSKITLEKLNWFGTFNNNIDMPPDSGGGTCTCDTLDLLSVDSAASTITLNMANKIQRIFNIPAVLVVGKTFDIINDTLALSHKIIFTTGDTELEFVFPNNYRMKPSDPRWDAASFTFTAENAGVQECEAVWDGTYWNLTIKS